MNVFISYSTQDSAMVKLFASALRSQPKVDVVHWWEGSKVPGKDLWQSIFGWIDEADIVMAVITSNTLERAMSVGNEVGYAKAKKKRITAFVTPEIEAASLGCLSPDIHVPLVPGEIEAGIERVLAAKRRKVVRHGGKKVVFEENESALLKPLFAFAATYIIRHWISDES